MAGAKISTIMPTLLALYELVAEVTLEPGGEFHFSLKGVKIADANEISGQETITDHVREMTDMIKMQMQMVAQAMEAQTMEGATDA